MVTKQEFLSRTRISAQLSDRQVLPFLQDAEDYDLPTLLPGNLILELSKLAFTAAEWLPGTAYLSEDFVKHDNWYYQALQDATGITPGTDAAIWLPDYKRTLRYIHLPNFLIWSAYYRMLLEHGRNITEAGLTVPSDPSGTYQQGSDKARGELMASAKDKANRHRAKIEAFLVAYNLINRASCAPTNRRSSGRITAI
jgi:hypothetical protein